MLLAQTPRAWTHMENIEMREMSHWVAGRDPNNKFDPTKGTFGDGSGKGGGGPLF